MTDEKEKMIETAETIEKSMQPLPQSLELSEELSELDLENAAGGCVFTKHPGVGV